MKKRIRLFVKRFLCLHEYKEYYPQSCRCDKCGDEISFPW